MFVRYYLIKYFEDLQCINNNSERCSGPSRSTKKKNYIQLLLVTFTLSSKNMAIQSQLNRTVTANVKE